MKTLEKILSLRALERTLERVLSIRSLKRTF